MLERMTIRIPKNHRDPALIRLVLSYAAYSVLGTKTALGMGGFTVLPAENFSWLFLVRYGRMCIQMYLVDR